jgi:thiol-disulfide isomerase/thioredoxin
MAGGGAWVAFSLVRVNKRLMFASLAVAAAVVTTVAVVAATHAGSNKTIDDVTITNPGDLQQPIGTNAAVSGRALPTLDVQTVKGDAFSTAGLVGRPLVVNLWYSTCAPCKRELPAFAAAQAKYGDTVRFVGINPSGLDPQTEDKFARDKGVQYELFYDPNGDLTSTLGIATLPQTLFIDSHGTIVDQTGELTDAKLEDLIRTKLL